MATPASSRPSTGPSPKPHGIYATPPTPCATNPMFDEALLCLDGPFTTQSLEPMLPNMPANIPANTPYSQHSSAFTSPRLQQQSVSPADTTQSQTSYNSFSPTQNYLDPRSSSSPSYDMMSGYSGRTTPGFDIDPLEDLGLEINTFDGEGIEQALTSASSGYPPSPRLTASPRPLHASPPDSAPLVQSSHGLQDSHLVKVEYFTPDAQHNSAMHHPTPSYTHQDSSSSSSSGLGGVGSNTEAATIRRGEDGSWRGGVDPATRGGDYLPFSLKEQEVNNVRAAKNAEVEDWLKKGTERLPQKPTEARKTEGGLVAPRHVRRRAKSIGDFRKSQTFVDGIPVGPGNCGTGGAAKTEGTFPDYDEESDESSVVSVASGFQEGSLDEPLDGEVLDEPVPSVEELKKAEQEAEAAARAEDEDEANYPKPHQFFSRARPWKDSLDTPTRSSSNSRYQPVTANAAMTKFQRHADNIETASRVATFGSNMTKGTRRHSIGSDAEKVLGGPFKRLSFGRDKEKKTHVSRKPSIWGNLRRTLSNSGDKAGDKPSPSEDKSKDQQSQPNSKLSTPAVSRKRGHSFNSATGSPSRSFAPGLNPMFKPSTIRVQTDGIAGAFAQMASPLMAAGAGKNSAPASTPSSGTITGRPSLSSTRDILQKVTRSRSKSELQTSQHVFSIMTTLAGPALPMTSPPDEHLHKKFTFGEESRKRGLADAKKLLSPNDARPSRTAEEDEDEDMEDDDVGASPVLARSPGGSGIPATKLVIVPTLDGFAQNVRTLTPGLHNKLVERVAHEQVKRFKKLVDHRQKHLAALKAHGKCSNNAKCRRVTGAIGVGGDGVVSVSGHKRSISKPGSYNGDAFDSSDENDNDSEGNVAAAQFPPGVPTPPVSRLPAEFECPICFKVKKFSKPSDWTKHVHEDVQPFTCTFPDCTEPKSFKRKADWVRHENERHRHLEWWTCTQPDCTHTCYRKDNFVQHLVREHKMAEPKVKKATAMPTGSNAGGPTQSEIDRVWNIVDDCHRDTDKLPTSEKCRFCGSTSSTWKKLTVHLARHMEAISLPVLDLIRDDVVVPASTRAAAARREPQRQPAFVHTLPSQPQQPKPLSQQQQLPSQRMDMDPRSNAVASRLSPDGDYEPDDQSYPPAQNLSSNGFLPSQTRSQNVPTYNLTPPQPTGPTHARSRSMPPHELQQYGSMHHTTHQPTMSMSTAYGHQPTAGVGQNEYFPQQQQQRSPQQLRQAGYAQQQGMQQSIYQGPPPQQQIFQPELNGMRNGINDGINGMNGMGPGPGPGPEFYMQGVSNGDDLLNIHHPHPHPGLYQNYMQGQM